MREQGHWKGEVTHLHKEGAPLDLLLSISQTRDVQGKVDGYVMVCSDSGEGKGLTLEVTVPQKEPTLH